MSKQTISVELVGYVDLDYAQLSDAIATLQELYDQFRDQKPYLVINSYQDTYVTLRGERLETDEEYQKRLDEQKSYQQRQIEAARKLLKEAGELP